MRPREAIWTTVPSCRLEFSPTRMPGPSPRRMQPNQMLALAAISTSPISVALGAMNADAATLGTKPLNGTMRPDIDLLHKRRRAPPGRPPKPLLCPGALALGELEAATRTGAAVLLALDHAAVADEEAGGLDAAAQRGLELGERLRDAVTHRACLDRKSVV